MRLELRQEFHVPSLSELHFTPDGVSASTDIVTINMALLTEGMALLTEGGARCAG